MSDVQNFYAGKVIFITGATGFLGHVLLSKLLSSCPDIRCIYILLRDKKEKSVDRRVQEIIENPIFNLAKRLNPDFANKIKPIKGDCSFNKLNISDDDRAIIETEVDIIFHAAASVRFDSELRNAAYINIQSTGILLEMAKNMKNLKAFVYVSTAFSACVERDVIEEKFYDAPIKADDLLMPIRKLDDKTLNQISPHLIKPYPNTYIFTKIIAENLCHEKGTGLPLSIFRPSIVSPCYQEPMVGWVNNNHGPAGVIAAYAKGVLKVIRADSACKADLIPCDYTINALIVAAYRTSQLWENSVEGKSEFHIPIFNYSNTTTKFNFTWRRFHQECKKALEKYPFCDIVTLPFLVDVKNRVIFDFLIIVFHKVPVYIIDAILLVCREQPRFINLSRKVDKILNMVAFFCTKEWTIPNNNMDQIRSTLSEVDKRTFDFNLNDLNVEKYFESYVRGVRSYIANDNEQTIHKAIKQHKKFLIINYVAVVTVVMVFANLLIKLFY